MLLNQMNNFSVHQISFCKHNLRCPYLQKRMALIITVYQRTPDIAIDLSRKLGRGALRGQYFSVFSCKYLKILCK